MSFKQNGSVWDLRAVVPAGETCIFRLPNRGKPCSVTAQAAAGGYLSLEFSNSAPSVGEGEAIWLPYATEVEQGGGDSIAPITAYRVTAFAADVTVDIAQGV